LSAISRDHAGYQPEHPAYVGVSHTVCVPDGTTDQFNCSTTISSKTGNVELDSMSATITVSPDGKTWVATNEQSSGS
jgi:hypothetical protein